MRKIDWEKPLSNDDIAFLRQAGIPGMMDRVEMHQAQFKAAVPEAEIPEDPITKSALDPNARTADLVPGFEHVGAPQKVDPTATPEGDDEDDDYDSWKVAELEADVKARNEMPDTTQVTVVGTGREGNVTKPDLIKGLRLWDRENPGAL